MRSGARLVRPLLILVWLCAARASYAAGPATHAPLGEGAMASIRVGRALYLECRPPKGKGRDAFLRKYLADPKNAAAYKDVSAAAIPFNQLNSETQRAVLLALFKDDAVDGQG